MHAATHALVLAAGKGTRMDSPLAKVLHRAAGRPLLAWVLDHLADAGLDRITVVVGADAEAVRELLPQGVGAVVQAEQLGTGHAVRCARKALGGLEGTVLVTCGDMPLVSGATYRALMAHHGRTRSACTLLAARPSDPGAYGRVVRAPDGAVRRIVEAADATDDERALREVNTGVYAFEAQALSEVLGRIGRANRQGEYYLTDAMGLLCDQGERVEALTCEDPDEAQGVNTPEDLARVADLLGAREPSARAGL